MTAVENKPSGTTREGEAFDGRLNPGELEARRACDLRHRRALTATGATAPRERSGVT